MDIFAQKKLLIRLVIVLAALNLCLISFFAYRDFAQQHHKRGFAPPPPQDIRAITAILQRELHLTEPQLTALQKLRSNFFEQEKILSNVIRGERDSMNVLMFNQTTNEAVVKQLAQNIANNEYQMELLRLAQAQQFKTLCTPKQLAQFQHLVREIRDYFKPPPPQKK